MPSSGVLASVSIDGKSAAIFSRAENFVVLLQGKGTHTIQTRFSAAVEEQGGLATIKFATLKIPVSHFELSMPGQKEVRVSPNAVLGRQTAGGKTVVTVNMPMTQEVSFSWSNVLPNSRTNEAKLHATLYHFALPEEGVLSLRTVISYELLRGEVTTAEIEVPAGFEVTRVQAPGQTITDWRVAKETSQTLYVTFQEPIKHDFMIDCTVERSLAKVGAPESRMTLLPLKAKNAARQRGIFALLAGKEVALSPLDDHAVMQVGENQIPAAIRSLVEQNVLHTFKYLDTNASLTVTPITPERKAGRFDAIVNSLFSLGDVSIRGAVKAHIQVKTGTIQDLALSIPGGVSVLSVVAPSMRNFTVEPAGKKQHILIKFTQEMEGAFPIDVQYEKLLAAQEIEPGLPTLHVESAEVEQGKFAVEALSAVEVQTGKVNEFSALELNEVPQEITLQTTNPLLLAFKYPRFIEQSAITLKVTRHQELETQAAVIDQAHFESFVTKENLTVTSAHYTLRNTKSQFLRLMLPKNSTVWSLTVHGEEVKPARAEQAGKEQILIKIINSRVGFPVELTYATPHSEMGIFGTLRAELPKADLVTTRTNWELYVPSEFAFGLPRTELSVIGISPIQSGARIQELASSIRATQVSLPLEISIPTGGIRYSLTKLYSNESDRSSEFSMLYLTNAFALPQLLATLAALLLGFIVAVKCGRGPTIAKSIAVVLSISALMLECLLVGYFQVGITSLLVVAIITAGWILYPTFKAKFFADESLASLLEKEGEAR